VKKLLRVNGFQESIIRTVLTAGPSPDGYSPAGKETFFILVQKFIPLPKNVYLRGAKVMTLEYHRECPEAKVTNYVAAIQHHLERTRRYAIEILYIHEGKVLEASASNFFMVKGKKLITPKEDILHGITRNCVIKLARKAGLEINERVITLDEALKADEVFITSTNKNIVPIVTIDNKKIGKGTVGPITSAVMGMFNKWLIASGGIRDFTNKYPSA
jgi:branched-chain amino acid aminotransferase